MVFTANDYFKQREATRKAQEETRIKRAEQQISSIQQSYSSGTPEYRAFAESRYNPEILKGAQPQQQRELSEIEKIRLANIESGFISVDPRIQTSEQRAKTTTENIILKRAMPSTLGRVSEGQGKIVLTKQEIEEPIGYKAAPKTENKASLLRKSGEEDIIKASRLRQEGKIGYGYEALGQTKKYIADVGEGAYETVKDPKTWVITGATFIATRNPQTAFATTKLLEAALPIYAYSELKQIGEKKKTFGRSSGEFLGYVGEYKTLGKASSFLKGSDIKFKAYPSEKKITFVGEGTIQGRKGKAVLVSTDEGSKLFFREGNKLSIFETKQGLDLDIKPRPTSQKIISQRQLGVTEATTSEMIKSKVGYLDKTTSLDLELFDIYKRKISVTPEITRITEITLKGREIKQFEILEQDISFGEPEARQDFFGKRKIEGGIEETLIKAPEVIETGLYKRTGKGKLVLFEEAPYKKILRSKKAGLIQESILEIKRPTTTTIYIEPKASRSIPKISIPTLTETTKVLPLNFPLSSQKNIFETKQGFDIDIKPISKQPMSFMTDIKQDYKIDLFPVTTPIQKTGLSTRQDYKTKQDTFLDTSFIAPPSSFDFGMGIEEPNILIPPPFIELGLPIKQLGGADIKRRKGKKTKIKYKYSLSLTGIAFNLKTPLTKKKKTLTGFEVRGL